jgi:hypothetical protein
MRDDLKLLIGKKILRTVASNGYTNATAILFDDGKTFIHLEEQDYYCYHDCSSSARIMDIRENEQEWNFYNNLKDAKELT